MPVVTLILCPLVWEIPLETARRHCNEANVHNCPAHSQVLLAISAVSGSRTLAAAASPHFAAGHYMTDRWAKGLSLISWLVPRIHS